MLPEPLTEQQHREIALAFAHQLDGVAIGDALYILKELAPVLILNSHAINKENINAAKDRLASGGRV